MKLRSFFYTVAGGVIVLLLIGLAGFSWLTSQSPLNLLKGGVASNPAAAMFVPKEAPVMVSLLVNPDRLEAFRQVAANPTNRSRSREELNKIKQNLLANTGLDYQRDIKPWLGDEITLAITSLDFDRNQKNGQQPGYLLAVTTKNADRAKDFVQLFWEKQAIAGNDLVFEKYQGVKLIYNQEPSASIAQSSLKTTSKSALPAPKLQPSTLASAVVGDRYILFANHPKILRDAVNNVQAANLSLKDDSVYQQALKSLNEPHIGIAFVNLPGLATALGTTDKDAELSHQYESLAIALSIDRQGLLASTALLSASNQEAIATTSAKMPVGAGSYIPATSAFVASGINLDRGWNQISTAIASNNSLKQLVEQPLQNLQSRWGINLPQDIFSWVEGEYALALLPRADKSNLDWVFVAERSTKAEEALENLDAVARGKGLNIASLPLADKSISAWTKLTTTNSKNQTGKIALDAEVEGVHTSAGKYEIFATSLDAIAQALKAPQNSLIASEEFKQAIAPLPQSNSGYLYINWQPSQPYLERQLPIVQVAELIGKPLFDNLRSLSVSSFSDENSIQRSKLFFRLGNAK